MTDTSRVRFHLGHLHTRQKNQQNECGEGDIIQVEWCGLTRSRQEEQATDHQARETRRVERHAMQCCGGKEHLVRDESRMVASQAITKEA